MRNTYSPWGELAGIPSLTLEWAVLPGRRLGEYLKQQSLIRLDSRMPRRQARSVLCHELRHHEYGDHGLDCAVANAKQEMKADSAAARMLIDVEDLADALSIHGHHRSAVAVELRVSVAMVDVRLDRLHPSERHYLRRRFEESGPL